MLYRVEESPNTTRKHAVENTRESSVKAGGDGKCHRKQTTRGLGFAGSGEKLEQARPNLLERVKRRGKSPPPGE